MDQSRYKSLLFSRDDRVLTITINRPQTLNGIDHNLHQELSRVFDEAADDPDSDVIVLTGAGKAFSAGGDLQWLRGQVEGEREPFVLESRAVRRIVYGILDCPKPTIAAVNGDAFGLGASISLLCDIVIAVDTARFADPHVKVGLVAGDGGALIWPQLIGFGKAKHYLLTGDPIPAKEAERCNLISFAIPPEEFHSFVENYSRKLARGAQVAIRYTKTTTNIALRQLFNSVFEAGVAYEGLSQYTHDHREGVMGFLEKRKPEFRGN